jgi:tmRNA-binding protein
MKQQCEVNKTHFIKQANKQTNKQTTTILSMCMYFNEINIKVCMIIGIKHMNKNSNI